MKNHIEQWLLENQRDGKNNSFFKLFKSCKWPQIQKEISEFYLNIKEAFAIKDLNIKKIELIISYKKHEFKKITNCYYVNISTIHNSKWN